MSKKFQILFALLIMLSMLLGACAPVAEPAVVTQAVVVTEAPEPTEVPPTQAPEPTPVPPTEVPPPDFAALMSEVIASIPADKAYGTVKAADLNTALVEKPPFLLDVREAAEIEKDGYIAGAVSVPIKELLKNLDKLPGLDEPIVIYCASGHRGAIAMSVLKMLGYTDVKNLGGGLGAWKKAGLATETGAPAAAAKISTPIVEDEALFTALDEFLSTLPEGFATVKPDVLNEALAGDEAPFILDVRTADEFAKDGYIDGAVNIPMQELLSSLDQLPAMEEPVVIYCASGHRGAVAMTALKLLGYTDVKNLGGGLNAWKAAQFPVAGWVDWTTVWSEYLAAMPENFYSIKAPDLNTALAENPPFLLDVREAGEIEKDGFIQGAVNIPVRDVLKNLDKLPALDQPIVVYCASGHRGGMIMAALQHLGYTDVKNLAGGLGAWKKAELSVEMGAPAAPTPGTAPEVDAARLRDLDAFLSALPEGFYSVKAPDLQAELAAADAKPAIFDVRTPEEYAGGYIEGAVNVPIQQLLADMAALPAKDAPVVVLCQSGHRGAIGMMALRMLGWTDVLNLAGGMNAWTAAELPVVQ